MGDESKPAESPPVEQEPRRRSIAHRIHECLGTDLAYFTHARHNARTLRKHYPKTARDVELAATIKAIVDIAEKLDVIDAYNLGGYPVSEGQTIPYNGEFTRATLIAMARPLLKKAGLPKNLFDTVNRRVNETTAKKQGHIGFTMSADKPGFKEGTK